MTTIKTFTPYQNATAKTLIIAINIVKPKQDSIKIMDSTSPPTPEGGVTYATREDIKTRIMVINKSLKARGFNFDEIESFWNDVFVEAGCIQTAKKKKKSKPCSHRIKNIEVIATCVTCEVTQVVCKSCRAILSEPKMEC